MRLSDLMEISKLEIPQTKYRWRVYPRIWLYQAKRVFRERIR